MTYVNNKVAVVTGGSRGIGFAIVQHLLRNGAAYVAILDVHKTDSETVRNMTQELEKEFGKQKFGYYICNVTDEKQFIACYDEVIKIQNYVDILVNNAGICNENNPDLMITINFTAVVKCTITAIERISKHKGHRGGCVINIASIYGLMYVPISPVYNATKHAVVSYVRSLKDHNETLGMRIMCICPGVTKTLLLTQNPKEVLSDYIPKQCLVQHAKLYQQSPDTVALAAMEILEKGKEGAVWITQNDQPPMTV